MPFEPTRFCELADALYDNAAFNREARARTAISRAYYALFLEVRSAIRSAEGRATHGRNDRIDHGRLPNVLFATADDGLIDLAKELQRLYDLRRQADYELESDRGEPKCEKPSNARLAVKQAQAALRRIPTLDWSQVRGKI